MDNSHALQKFILSERATENWFALITPYSWQRQHQAVGILLFTGVDEKVAGAKYIARKKERRLAFEQTMTVTAELRWREIA